MVHNYIKYTKNITGALKYIMAVVYYSYNNCALYTPNQMCPMAYVVNRATCTSTHTFFIRSFFLAV